jgi:ADP-heptose:LPS heptosyltransferase
MAAFPQRIIISRTDNLGDVILTLPVAGWIKQHHPSAQVLFIGKAYTQPLIEASVHVEQFIDREALLSDPQLFKSLRADAIVFVFPDRELARLASKAGVPIRVGTSHRWFHWLYCNRLVLLSRRSSNQHEAQLNLQLLRPLGLAFSGETEEMPVLYGMSRIPSLSRATLLRPERFHLILHPKSKGSAREWPLENYQALVQELPPDHFQIFITGTAAEGDLVRQQQPQLLQHPHVTDLTGQLSLGQLLAFIARADGLVACSTGPLHIAAALGKYALGIYPPMQPLHPGRWAPLGKRASWLSLDKTCNDCRKTQNCACIRSIGVAQVKTTVEGWMKQIRE